MTREDMLELARKIRYDTTAIQGKLTTLMEAISSLPEEGTGKSKCPICGVTTRGPLSLAEHIHTSHDGPIPAAWLEAERKAGIEQPAGHMMGTDA